MTRSSGLLLLCSFWCHSSIIPPCTNTGNVYCLLGQLLQHAKQVAKWVMDAVLSYKMKALNRVPCTATPQQAYITCKSPILSC
jgi:hypothetical protein